MLKDVKSSVFGSTRRLSTGNKHYVTLMTR